MRHVHVQAPSSHQAVIRTQTRQTWVFTGLIGICVITLLFLSQPVPPPPIPLPQVSYLCL
jgi:hypothetical protein